MKDNASHLKLLAVASCLFPLSLLARTEAKPVSQDKPLAFIENAGQTIDQHGKQRKDIDYKLSVPGMNIFIGNGQIHYQWNKTVGSQQLAVPGMNRESHDVLTGNDKSIPTSVETYRMDVTLVGANLNMPASPQDMQPYTERYYTPQFGEEGGMAHTYNTVVYKNVYPHIDWVLYTKNGTLKYDFIVHPGGNPQNIQLQYKGATTLALKDGAITAITPFGSVTEQKPFTFDQQTKQEIASKFVLTGNTVGFDITTHESTVVIDPKINWSTYYGGNGEDAACGLAADASGNAYMCGYTYSTNNIATVGSFQATLNVNSTYTDGFVAKFNAAGVRQWATYYGGTGTDNFWSAALDPAGNIYCGGSTNSTSGIATTGAHQTTFGGTNWDDMLVKFTNAGARVWATYYGGNGDEWLGGNVSCDNAGNVFMSGNTSSTNNIATNGAYQSSYNGGDDGYLVKFNASGVRQWGTYYGTASYDVNRGITGDGNGNVYITGGTSSTTGLATTGAHQAASGGGSIDAYIAKFNGNGGILWASYYGGGGGEEFGRSAVDNSGNVYAAGSTTSTSGIATTGAYKTSLSGSGDDGFIVKFNASGVRQWGTYYGGSNSDGAGSISVGSEGYIYVTGQTASSNGIATPGTYQASLGGGFDVFLVEMNAITGYPRWATYFGGLYNEWAVCAWSPAGYIYIAGNTLSTTGIATTGAHQTSFGSGYDDGFLASFVTDTMVYIKQPYTDTLFCPGDSFKVAFGVNRNFKPGNTFTVQLSNASGSFASPVNIGSKTISVADTIKCQVPFSTPVGTGYRIRIVASNPSDTSVDDGMNIKVTNIPPILNATNNGPLCPGNTLNLSAVAFTSGMVTYSWTGPNSFNSAQQNPTIPSVTATHGGDYIVTVTSGGCTAKDTTTVVVNIIPATPTPGSNSPICSDSTIKLNASSTTAGVTYTWSGPASFSSTTQNPSVNNVTTSNAGIYLVTATLNGCTSPAAATSVVVYSPTPIPVAGSNTPVCEGAVLNLTAGTVPGASYEWTGPKGFTSTQQNPVINPTFISQSGLYIVRAVLNGCYSKPDTAAVIINQISTVGAYASPNDTVCTGMITTFVAYPFNAGSNPQFQWFKNGIAIPGATSDVYNTTNLVTGDSFYCRMIAPGICGTTLMLFTNGIKMVVHSVVVVPSVTITSNPAQPIPGQPAVFYASHVNGGPFPAYQWRRDGKNVPGAVFANWNVNDLHPYEKISCVLTSSDSCAQPRTDTSNEIVGNFSVHIGSLNSMDDVSLYPNPTNGNFTLKTMQKGILQVYTLQGQLVSSYEIAEHETHISLPASLTPGVYMGRFIDNGGKVSILKIDYQQ